VAIDFEMLRKTIAAFNDFVNETLNQNVLSLLERIHLGISYTAGEDTTGSFSNSLKYPTRVPLHMVASYLAIFCRNFKRDQKPVWLKVIFLSCFLRRFRAI
jgi:hypothetical protein